MIEVRYAGVVVGRSAVIRELDTRGLFLGVTEPLPVGTPVVLRIGDRPDAPEVQGKVEVVSESPELAHAGMRVRFAEPGAAALFGEPTGATSDARSQAISGPRSGPVVAGTVVASSSRPESSAPVPTEAPGTVASDHPVSPPASVPSARAVAPTEVEGVPDKSALDSGAVPQASGDDDGDESQGASVGVAAGTQASGRIPAPDPSAFGGHGGGKKNRKNRRR